MTNFGLNKAALYILFASLTTGCALTIPLHEGRSPETLGPKTLRGSLGTGTTATVGTASGSTTPEDDAFNEQTGSFSTLRGEFGLTEKIELTGESFGGSTGGGYGAGARFQWFGPNVMKAKAGESSMTTGIQVWSLDTKDSDLDDYVGNAFSYADFEAIGVQLTHSYGYRLGDQWVGYFGARYVNYEMTAEYKNTSGGPVVLTEDRSFYGYGGFLGIALSAMYQGFGFELIAETNLMNMPEVYGSGRTNYRTTNFFVSVPFQL